MNVHLKILSLEDVEDDIGLIERTLSRNNISFEIKRVDTRADFVGALRHFRPDVILSDHSLPQFNSVEALKICKRLHSSVPFILVTGAVSEEFAVTCLKEGADDYVLKSNLARLPSAIQNALKQREAEAQQRRVEQELRIQNDELAKVNKEMDSFIYSVSHNIRSPLASVLGLLDLAARDDQARDRFFSEYFSMMNRSIKKLDDTLREILDIRQVIELNLEQLKYLSGFENIQVQIKVVQDEAFYADKARLSVILCNLISNSIKYRDPSKTENRLSISFLLEKRTAELSVEDNGIGIAEEVLPNVFNMFFRGTEKSDGAGLGLYIVKESVSKLKGEVTIESRVGHGTVCRIVMRQATWVGRELSATGGRSVHAE
jgi:K+-sensing histidine kinase KdpD